ncbi:MAG: hypothetical protein R3304_05465 [Longimicrobiales bacterium]|nr:hypothetical protein [Longimicrobiales bacterium]
MRLRPCSVSVGAATLLLLAHALAASGQSTLSTRVDTTLITVGDRLTLEVTVEHPASAVVSWPDSVDAGPFELLELRVEPMEPRNGVAVSSARFAVTAFELGELELPPLSVRVLHPDGREEHLSTEAYGVEVVSVGVDETGDIRDIRGPLRLPLGVFRVVSWVLVLLFLAAAGYALWRRLRSDDGVPERLRGPPPVRPTRSPWTPCPTSSVAVSSRRVGSRSSTSGSRRSCAGSSKRDIGYRPSR